METSLENHVESEAVKIEEMKLPQLKELAKSRGLKGYSKLKKSELVELLIGC
uniref:Rho termination factor-like N-terminal domain-containing protein n=2 Tax=Solanum lycopersicum TaxID=4081 RepID=A0A3Q7F3B7_SOLLC